MTEYCFKSESEDLARQCLGVKGKTEQFNRVAKALECWMDDAARYARNSDFWHELVMDCANNLGPIKHEAYVCDDGSTSQDVLGLKVPGLVKKLADRTKKRAPRLLVVGHARHGKDTVCEMLNRDYGFSFESSSVFCMKLFIFEALKGKYGYKDYSECHADCRASAERRAEWFDLIAEFNKDDAARLGKALFNEYSVYCGLRNDREFNAMKLEGVFDYSIWVDRSKHLPPEPTSSMTIERERCDIEIDNNGTLEDLGCNVAEMMQDINTFFR